jgi:hypothetical protein
VTEILHARRIFLKSALLLSPILTGCNSEQSQPMVSSLAASLKLYRKTLFSFYGMESGTFMTMPWGPFGGVSPLLSRIAELLEMKNPATESEMVVLAEIYLAWCADFRDITRNMRLSPGVYSVPDVVRGWNAVDEHEGDADQSYYIQSFHAALNNGFADYAQDFEVTQAHLAMLQSPQMIYRLEYDWQYFGNPLDFKSEMNNKAVQFLVDRHKKDTAKPDDFYEQLILCGDGKRPYGDRTYYYWDLEDAGIFKADAEMDQQAQRRLFSDESQARIDKLQSELYRVLQALALYGVFEVSGDFSKSD